MMKTTLAKAVSKLQEYTPPIGRERQEDYTPMLLAKPPQEPEATSALDRINVRRLLIEIERVISDAASFTLFEFNDELTRFQFHELVNPYLKNLQERDLIRDYSVFCDETNNHPQDIASNKFVADIYLKPAPSINYIVLNFVATRTGVDFDEISGAF